MGHYKQAVERMKRYREQYLSLKVLAKGDEEKFVYQPLRGGYGSQLVSPWKGYATRTIEMGLLELPPGHHKNTHRHSEEAILFILEGKGYSIVEGVKIEWEAGDALTVPAWLWHSQWNPGPGIVRYFTLKNKGLLEAQFAYRSDNLNDAKYLAENITVKEKYFLREMSGEMDKESESVKE